MHKTNFLDLVKLSLPEDMSPEEFMSFGSFSKDIWRERPRIACVWSLRYHPRIDWQAYIERYEDVKRSCSDPCLHFIKHGIYEGRKLITGHPHHQVIASSAKISVILINYNNSLWLERAIDSLIFQTLYEIEIIIVDDCSSDDSLKIIEYYARSDSRIKIVKHSSNKGAFLARKSGVEVSNSPYVMFLDSDDAYKPNACSIAYNNIIKGFDVVTFGVEIVDILGKSTPDKIGELNIKFNSYEAREYLQNELLDFFFLKSDTKYNLWTRIYKREIVINAYNDLPNIYANFATDYFLSIAIYQHTRRLLAIKDKLIMYTYGVGVWANIASTSLYKKFESLYAMDREIDNFIVSHGITRDIKRFFVDIPSKMLQEICRANYLDFSISLNKIIKWYGITRIALILLELHPELKKHFLHGFKYMDIEGTRNVRRIGIYYPNLKYGGIEKVISNMAYNLTECGFKVIVFTSIGYELDIPLPKETSIMTTAQSDSGVQERRNHITSFENAIKACPIDLMFYENYYDSCLLEDMFILKCHQIPVIVRKHRYFAVSMGMNKDSSSINFEDIWKAASAVICLSLDDEMFLRSRGINAWYIPHPIPHFGAEQNRDFIPKNIAFVGRLSEPVKQIGECTKIFRMVLDHIPNAKLYMIGNFANDAHKKYFEEGLYKMGLSGKVYITGYLQNIFPMLRKCGLLLCTSATEGFGLAIGEAQSIGLPCVMYDIPTPLAEDNESIIRIPQGNAEAAAAAIIKILTDETKWHLLSKVAREKASRFSLKRFREEISELIANVSNYSPMHYYERERYRRVAKYLSFYIRNPI